METVTKTEYAKGTTLQDEDGKTYLVKNCRKLVVFLGEPEGYLLELEEIKQ